MILLENECFLTLIMIHQVMKIAKNKDQKLLSF